MNKFSNILKVILCLLGWIISYTYCFHIIGPYSDPCTGGIVDSYLFSIFAGPITLTISGLLIFFGLKWCRIIRWASLPHLGTLIIAAFILPPYLLDVTIGGEFICGADWKGLSATNWQRLYPIVHILFILLFVIFIGFLWKKPNQKINPAD